MGLNDRIGWSKVCRIRSHQHRSDPTERQSIQHLSSARTSRYISSAEWRACTVVSVIGFQCAGCLMELVQAAGAHSSGLITQDGYASFAMSYPASGAGVAKVYWDEPVSDGNDIPNDNFLARMRSFTLLQDTNSRCTPSSQLHGQAQSPISHAATGRPMT